MSDIKKMLDAYIEEIFYMQNGDETARRAAILAEFEKRDARIAELEAERNELVQRVHRMDHDNLMRMSPDEARKIGL